MSKFLSHAIAAALLFAPLSAHAAAHVADDRPVSNITQDVMSFLGFGADQANNPTDPAPVAAVPERPKQPILPRAILPSAAALDAPSLPAVVAASAPSPSVETPLRRLFCVEYARMRSGLAVFGDAKHWWERARNLYARLPHPVEEAVMVFSGSKRLKRGHVAVVTRVVSAREVIVDQANWMNRGEIDHATPVMDVSKANDWSQVRVWDIPSGTFGARTYAISGFIAKGLTRQALND